MYFVVFCRLCINSYLLHFESEYLSVGDNVLIRTIFILLCVNVSRAVGTGASSLPALSLGMWIDSKQMERGYAFEPC